MKIGYTQQRRVQNPKANLYNRTHFQQATRSWGSSQPRSASRINTALKVNQHVNIVIMACWWYIVLPSPTQEQPTPTQQFYLLQCSLLALSYLIYYRVTAGWGIFHPPCSLLVGSTPLYNHVYTAQVDFWGVNKRDSAISRSAFLAPFGLKKALWTAYLHEFRAEFAVYCLVFRQVNFRQTRSTHFSLLAQAADASPLLLLDLLRNPQLCLVWHSLLLLL